MEVELLDMPLFYEQSTTEWSKAGIEMRETLTNTSIHIDNVMSLQGYLTYQYRPDTGNITYESTGIYLNPYPIWLQMVKTGSTFSNYYKSNATGPWIPLSTNNTVTLTNFSSTYYYGLLVCRHNITYSHGTEPEPGAIPIGATFSWSSINVTIPPQCGTSTIPCPCPRPNPLAVCGSNLNWYVNGFGETNTSLTLNTNFVVTGNFSVQTGVVNLNNGAVLNITGCAAFNGTSLNITIDVASLSNTSSIANGFSVVNYGCLNAKFDNITTNLLNNTGCSFYNTNDVYGPHSITVLFSFENNCKGNQFPIWAIVVIVCVVSVAIIIGIVLFYNKKQLRHRKLGSIQEHE